MEMDEIARLKARLEWLSRMEAELKQHEALTNSLQESLAAATGEPINDDEEEIAQCLH
jgi:hypothetical protein